MDKRKIDVKIYFWFILLLMMGCTGKPSYDELVSRELARGVKVDSLFHGIYFNMTMESFYDHSYKMNQKGIFFQNDLNVEVVVHYDEGYSHPVDFVFFPEGPFRSIQRMRGYMKYQKWSPFTKTLTAKKLQEEVRKNFETQYGGQKFIEIPHPKGFWPTAYVKVDGNRKILLYRSFDDQRVEMEFENLDKEGLK